MLGVRCFCKERKGRRMAKYRLLAPGPTPVPPEVLMKMAEPIIHHRTDEYSKVTESVTRGLKGICKTEGDCIVLAGSGTAAMEAAVANVLSPGDEAICVVGGKFGERWVEICRAYSIEPVAIDVTWGEAVEAARVAEALKEHPDAKAVYTTLCETSTAVKTDIKALGDIVRSTQAILVVDGISGVGAMEMRTDEWGVDMLVVGSQKALMLPPGLAAITVSEKAWKLVESSTSPRYYLDLATARKSLEKWSTPFTPAVTLVRALDESIKLIEKQGIENVWARSAKLADACRGAVRAMGLEVFSKAPAEAVTAVRLPEDVDGAKVPGVMREKYGVQIAGGQAQLKGKICRIAHMGYIDEFDLLAAVTALEAVLREMGVDITAGVGAGAIEKAFA